MANALKDGNSTATLLAVLNTDTIQGKNKVRIAVDPANNSILVDFTSGISFTIEPIDPRDENYVRVWAFQGNVDGLLYPAVATSKGALLVSSN
jgi:hypothetical protein